jgi:enoyl-CoA hydratase
MKDLEFVSNYKRNFLGDWTAITTTRKPIIAAVNGVALGGGCEIGIMKHTNLSNDVRYDFCR